MALRAATDYVKVDRSDLNYLNILRCFFGVEDVSEQEALIYDYCKQNAAEISTARVIKSHRFASWYRVISDELYVYADGYGYARSMLLAYILEKGLLNHMYYPLSSEIMSALSYPDSVLRDKLTRVGKPVSVTSPFTYKVSKSQSRSLAVEYGLDSRYGGDLIFSIGNYLGRRPLKSEVMGETSLPVAAIRKSSLRVKVGDDVTDNERQLAEINLEGRNKQGDPVIGVRFLTMSSEVEAVAKNIFRQVDLKLCLSLPGVVWEIIKALDVRSRQFLSFEDRVECFKLAEKDVRDRIGHLLITKPEEPLSVTLGSEKMLKGEIYGGDPAVLTTRLQSKFVCDTLMRVSSPFSKEEYSKLTKELVSALWFENHQYPINFLEATLIILQRFIHYRTNANRYISLPKFGMFLHGKKLIRISFKAVDDVFWKYQQTMPEIERAWCAPLATVAYFLLKDTGGSFAKWKDIPDVPPALCFDFAKYIDGRYLSETERASLAVMLHRFSKVDTKKGGFNISERLLNPVDHLLEHLDVSTLSKEKLKRLL